MKVAAIQSNYIPWKGYFDIINSVDLFVFYDDAQYTHKDWRNRNQIKTPTGLQWLTIPIGSNRSQKIYEIQIINSYWQKKHWQSIVHNYSKAKYFRTYKIFFEQLYLEYKWTNLSSFNQFVIKKISREILNINTTIEDSRKYYLKGNGKERVLDLLLKCNAAEYLCGPSAKSYLKEEFLQHEKIKLIWVNYDSYPEYNQLYPPFNHYVSIIDLIFNEGPNARYFMKSFNQNGNSRI
ncbi:MAG: WbqC family protein [Draconibacterium sp.]|nr:WbqC family protein [Draconibacterium sp.]